MPMQPCGSTPSTATVSSRFFPPNISPQLPFVLDGVETYEINREIVAAAYEKVFEHPDDHIASTITVSPWPIAPAPTQWLISRGDRPDGSRARIRRRHLIVADAAGNNGGLKLSRSSLSEWFKGKVVPNDPRYFTLLVQTLTGTGPSDELKRLYVWLSRRAGLGEERGEVRRQAAPMRCPYVLSCGGCRG
ncbi:hypothetical protein ACU5JM_04745 [Rhodococcus erythropolis]|uniref:hypothetical protein n=1 Tax=Rhodococcus erythropolis TaxID=1833 RepID=UPI00406BB41E